MHKHFATAGTTWKAGQTGHQVELHYVPGGSHHLPNRLPAALLNACDNALGKLEE